MKYEYAAMTKARMAHQGMATANHTAACIARHTIMPAFTQQKLLIVPHQSPSTVIVTLVWVAISKDEREDGFEEVHALPTFLPQSAAPHIVRVQIPEHI